MSIKIFSIKAVEFEHGSLDPFGFDAHTDRLARKYIPFSGTIRKPSTYYLSAMLSRYLGMDISSQRVVVIRKTYVCDLRNFLSMLGLVAMGACGVRGSLAIPFVT